MLNKELLLTPQSKAPIGEFRFYTSDYAEPVYWQAYDSGGAVRTGAVLYGNKGESGYGEPVYSHIEIRSWSVYILKDFIHYEHPMNVYYKDERLGELSNGLFSVYENSSVNNSSWYGYGGIGGLTNKDQLYLYLRD